MAAIVVEQTRGPLVENVYRGDIAVVSSSGEPLFAVGDPAKTTFWRSSAKPIQAMPIVFTGAAKAFGFGPAHLAMFCASHNGELVHTQTVLEAMTLAGLSPDLLQCGPHLPSDRDAANALTSAGQAPGRIHNNCSGKHTGMLALAKHMGFELEHYLDPASDLQRFILANVAEVVGLAPEQIVIGIDGCGVPVFGLPIANMAYAFARLAGPEWMPQGKEEAAREFRDAMIQFPYNVAGRRRICTELMTLPGQRFIAKSGAEGVYCVGIKAEAVAESKVLRAVGITGAIGIAVKAEDGHKDTRHIMAVEALRQLDLLTLDDRTALARYGLTPVTNWAGTVVGELRPAFALSRV